MRFTSSTCTAECESPKYERAALRWLERYLAEGSPRLEHFAATAMNLAHPRYATSDSAVVSHDGEPS